MLWDQARAAHMDIALDIKSAARSLSRAPGKGSLRREGCVPGLSGAEGEQVRPRCAGRRERAPNREITTALPPPRGLRGSADTPHPRDFLETEPWA